MSAFDFHLPTFFFSSKGRHMMWVWQMRVGQLTFSVSSAVPLQRPGKSLMREFCIIAIIFFGTLQLHMLLLCCILVYFLQRSHFFLQWWCPLSHIWAGGKIKGSIFWWTSCHQVPCPYKRCFTGLICCNCCLLYVFFSSELTFSS